MFCIIFFYLSCFFFKFLFFCNHSTFVNVFKEKKGKLQVKFCRSSTSTIFNFSSQSNFFHQVWLKQPHYYGANKAICIHRYFTGLILKNLSNLVMTVENWLKLITGQWNFRRTEAYRIRLSHIFEISSISN